MCNLYRMNTNAQAIARLFAPLAGHQVNPTAFHDIVPNAEAPIVVGRAHQFRLGTMRWGWPPFGQVKRPITNIRNLESPMWQQALEDPARRCLVPVTAFSEWSATPDSATGRKRKHWFGLNDTDLFAFAGLWTPTAQGPRFAFLTCQANTVVGRVHPKAMPVILDTTESCLRWLVADSSDAARMQQPFADARMHELADESQTGQRQVPDPPRQQSLF